MTGVLERAWSSRSQREQILLVVMALLLGATLLWLLILRPIGDAQRSAAETRDAAVQALGETRYYARQISALGAARPAKRHTAQALTATAGAVALTARSSESRDGTIRLAFDDAQPKVLFGWLAAMEAEGLPVRGLSAAPNGAAGLKAEVTFQRPQP
ncbi:type II secretion system protein GspM [Sphingosinicella sp. BN140058]|uniref:type II secretion system protein GspM n=1 Tax=Sphingosinicella sp. BN140058 TaxID=1892855 RepID=UPI0013E9EDC1|nr:type II secretion system protein GspM [Sphingosinicella sp. BN140058]